jgi:hypothetical protein
MIRERQDAFEATLSDRAPPDDPSLICTIAGALFYCSCCFIACAVNNRLGGNNADYTDMQDQWAAIQARTPPGAAPYRPQPVASTPPRAGPSTSVHSFIGSD